MKNKKQQLSAEYRVLLTLPEAKHLFYLLNSETMADKSGKIGLRTMKLGVKLVRALDSMHENWFSDDSIETLKK